MIFNNRIDVEWIEKYITVNDLPISLNNMQKKFLTQLDRYVGFSVRGVAVK